MHCAGLLPLARVYYAVKANPAPAIVAMLEGKGANFDVASRGEIELCVDNGVTADRLSYGNTIKKGKGHSLRPWHGRAALCLRQRA